MKLIQFRGILNKTFNRPKLSEPIIKELSKEFNPKTLVFTPKPIRTQNSNIDSYGKALVKLNPDFMQVKYMKTKDISTVINNTFKEVALETNNMSKIEDFITTNLEHIKKDKALATQVYSIIKACQDGFITSGEGLVALSKLIK